MLRHIVQTFILLGLAQQLLALPVEPVLRGATFLPEQKSITLAWDAVSDTRVLGYRVYTGTVSRTYTTSAQVVGRTTTTYTTPILGPGTWYFAVTAYTMDAASSYSTEANTVIAPDPLPVPTPTNFRIVGIPSVGGVGKYDAIINWSTTLAASCRVLLWQNSVLLTPTTGFGDHTSHSVRVTGLQRKRTYQYQAVSTLPSTGEEAKSDVFSFSTR